MNSLLLEQSSMESHIVVNYSSSYGRPLFRSPNSPPPSPSPSSMTSIAQLFHISKAGGAFKYSPLLPLPPHQPPLLPSPRSATLPTPGRSRRLQPKRKAKAAAAATTKKEIASQMLSAAIEKGERRELSAEFVYSLSPPPSSLPLPKFALVRSKAAGGGGGGGPCCVLK